MCLIVDTNCFGCFFDENNQDYKEFVPAHDWVFNKEGKLMYGGSTFLSEMGKANKYRRLILELNKKGKAISLDKNEVDIEEKRIKGMEPDPDFDDPHLVAMAIVGRCQIICTRDKRAFKFLKKKDFYPANVVRPKLYTGEQCKNLLCRKYISKTNLRKYYNKGI